MGEQSWSLESVGSACWRERDLCVLHSFSPSLSFSALRADSSSILAPRRVDLAHARMCDPIRRECVGVIGRCALMKITQDMVRAILISASFAQSAADINAVRT